MDHINQPTVETRQCIRYFAAKNCFSLSLPWPKAKIDIYFRVAKMVRENYVWWDVRNILKWTLTRRENFTVEPERWKSKWTEFIWRNTIFHLRSKWGIIPSLVAYTVSSNVFHRTFGKARFGFKNRQCYLSQEFDV